MNGEGCEYAPLALALAAVGRDGSESTVFRDATMFSQINYSGSHGGRSTVCVPAAREGREEKEEGPKYGIICFRFAKHIDYTRL
jgi:hypothetical protein